MQGSHPSLRWPKAHPLSPLRRRSDSYVTGRKAAVVLPSTSVSNPHIVHLKLAQCCVSVTSQLKGLSTFSSIAHHSLVNTYYAHFMKL